MSTIDAAGVSDRAARDSSTTLPVLASYAAGSLGTGAFGTLPGLVLAYYLTDSIGIAAALASVLVLVPKIVDVLAYPLIGALSDRASHSTGYRTGLMLFGALALPLLFIATFSAPADWSTGAAGIWVMGFFLAASLAYSCFQVPYLALPAELTDDSGRRVTLLAWRVAVLAAAILISGGGGPALRDVAGGGPRGYVVMAVGVAALMLVGMLWSTFISGRRTITRADAPAGDLVHAYRDGIDALRVTRPFRLLVGVFCLQAIATAVMLAGGQYMATHVLGNEAALTGLFLALVGPALLVMPLWTRLAHARGKVQALAAATALFTVASLLLIPAGIAPGGVGAPPGGAGGCGLCGHAGAADVHAARRHRSGQDVGGTTTKWSDERPVDGLGDRLHGTRSGDRPGPVGGGRVPLRRGVRSARLGGVGDRSGVLTGAGGTRRYQSADGPNSG